MQLQQFIENNYPNYFSSEDIARYNDLDKLLTEGGTDILERYGYTPLDIADGTVQKDFDDLELSILRECVKNVECDIELPF